MNKNIKSAAQGGFTLIELIVVIVILGILAATALPRFASLGGDARLASMNAVKGSLAATAAMAHAKYVANATSTPLPSITVEGAVITFPTTGTAAGTGYPVADAGFAAAAGLAIADYTIIYGVATAVPNKSPAAGFNELVVIPNSIAGTPAATTCFVRYTAPVAPNQVPTITVTGTAATCE
jgi:MSHA pilin protein MshA